MTDDTQQLIEQAITLLENYPATLMSKTTERYDLELDENTHWGLVKLGAELRMHAESYAEEILKAHVEHELGKQTTNQSD
jgi:hypothetical protein